MSKNPKYNWFPFVFIAIVVLLVLLSCNSVKKAKGGTKTETLTVYEYDTTHVKVIDTTHTLQEWIEIQTKTVELFDTVYTTVPILRQRIIYENVKASSKQTSAGISRDSVKVVSNGQTVSVSNSEYQNKETKRFPFWLALAMIILLTILLLLNYNRWRVK